MYVTLHIYSDLYVVAIDWPGHGLSSPRPAGSYYHMINYVADLKYVIDGMCGPSITYVYNMCTTIIIISNFYIMTYL